MTKNPILMVKNAGHGTTPVPEDAIVQPGENIGLNDYKTGEQIDAKVLAVVPPGVPVEYAKADQNGQPRPLMITPNPYKETLYVIQANDKEIYVRHSKMVAGLKRANESGLND